MTPEQYRALMAHFEALCDAPPDARAAGIAAVRADDAALGEALALMLAADDAADPTADPPATDEPAGAERRCPTCSDTFPDDVDFCPRHGRRLIDPSRPATPGLVGEVLDGRYRIEGLLGQGGMARVYRGQQLNVEREVAIKVLHDHLAAHDVVQHRFEREARIIAGLRHPNTLKLIDFGHTPSGALYIVSPLLTGDALDRVLDERGRLSVEQTLALLRQVAGALGEAHALGIVHRDLKPGNIFVEAVGGEEVFKVLDFGIAQWRGGTEHQTDTGLSVGTPAYMSPEQIEARRPLDGRSDIYSLGVVAYACLTGHLPWDNISAANMAIKHLHEPPRPFDAVLAPGAVPPLVEVLVGWMLEKRAADRPADVHALRAALDAIAAGRWRGPPGAPAPQQPSRPTRRAGLWIAVALLIGGLALAAAWRTDERASIDGSTGEAAIVSARPAEAVPGDASAVDPASSEEGAALADAAVNDGGAEAAQPAADSAVREPVDAADPAATATPRAPAAAPARRPADPPKTARPPAAARPAQDPAPAPEPDYVPAPGLY